MPARAKVPPRRAMVVWRGLALTVGFYALVLFIALVCVCAPGVPFINMLLNWNDLNPFEMRSYMMPIYFFIGAQIAVVSVRAMVPRGPAFTAPGPLLDRTTHPQLFGELDRIARALKERPPAEVYMIASPNVWVTNRGGFLGLGSRRVLAIGLPVLSILSVSQLRAILAHEFGHYYGGDSRFAPLLYKTRGAMVRTRDNLDSVSFGPFVTRSNLIRSAIRSILDSYFESYLDATREISQWQEFRADELACWIVGSQALVEGLKRIAVSEVFPTYWEKDVSPVIAAGYRPPIASGFTLYLQVPEVASGCQMALEAKTEPTGYISRIGRLGLSSITSSSSTTSVDDSDSTLVDPINGTVVLGLSSTTTSSTTIVDDGHPALSDRIQSALSIPHEDEMQNDEPAATLLDLDVAELQLLLNLNPELRNSENILKTVSWDEIAQLVLIPWWRKLVARVSTHLLQLTPQTLPDVDDRLLDIAKLLPNRWGVLTSPDQRKKQAAEVLEMALGLALLNNGWTLHYSPGQYVFTSGKQSFSVTHLMDKIRSGELSRTDWNAKCEALGIAELHLA